MASYGITFLLIAPVGFDQLLNIIGYYAKPTGSFGYYASWPTDYLVLATESAFSWKDTVDMFNSLTYFLGFFALGTLLVKHRINLKYYLSLLLVAALLLLFARLIALGVIVDQFIYFPVLFVLMHPAKLGMLASWSFFLMMAILINEVEARIALPHKATL